ncbi:MAG: Crp/Fnr family transcriptional regulator [Sphingobacteriaceae bacterium]|nr:MAG: Crp/Fnr family transcriptional regulator [Sphingobacteriaceae bacterium]
MSFELILQNISKHINLTPVESAHFTSLLYTRHLRRKDILLEDGDICKNSAFTIKGCLKGYTVDHNGDTHVLNFAPPGWWIADMYSLLSQKPGTLNIEANEETEVLLLSKTHQEQLYHDIPKFERFFRIITENSLVAYQQRLMDNLSLTAEDRFNNFCKRYPELVNGMSKKDIASYIGVTPEFFSRMQARMVRGK